MRHMAITTVEDHETNAQELANRPCLSTTSGRPNTVQNLSAVDRSQTSASGLLTSTTTTSILKRCSSVVQN